jgi:hypothetical protein
LYLRPLPHGQGSLRPGFIHCTPTAGGDDSLPCEPALLHPDDAAGSLALPPHRWRQSCSHIGPPIAAIKRRYRHASFVGDNRVISNIGGDKLVHVNLDFGIVYIKFVGTHAEYDRIDPETV